ncbi:MAG: thiol:disulfide interchange protein [Legionellales bacterium RIFCSPHIGHO2_12_FULL_35_11]|nr:MAG: thiol:disulfide interchange protein [Legionellales bacterium RIFCSPHIGHO2_12_FULL_35_11]
MIKYWRVIPLFLFVIIGYFFWSGLSLNPHELPSTKIDKKLPFFELDTLSTSSKKQIFSSNLFKDKPVLLNVWSSWCGACTEEQAFLLNLSQNGVSIYGLDYKDQALPAIEWLNTWGNPYIASGFDQFGKVGFELGVYGSPETFLIDKDGVVRIRYPGILTEEIWQKKFKNIYEQLEKM